MHKQSWTNNIQIIKQSNNFIMNTVVFILLFLNTFNIFLIKNSSIPPEKITSNCDSISTKNFNILKNEIYNKMLLGKELTVAETIKMVKIYNTLHLINTTQTQIKGNANDFVSLFDKSYTGFASKKLEATLGKGMTIYSKKYDIVIGVGAPYRCRNYYLINNK